MDIAACYEIATLIAKQCPLYNADFRLLFQFKRAHALQATAFKSESIFLAFSAFTLYANASDSGCAKYVFGFEIIYYRSSRSNLDNCPEVSARTPSTDKSLGISIIH